MQGVLSRSRRRRFHDDAYRFIVEALHFTQQRLDRPPAKHADDEEAHVTAAELMFGVRDYAAQQWGMMAPTVFRSWGVRSTDDFGRIVFELIERGEMRKTDRDQLSDFAHVFDFIDAFVENYKVDVQRAFASVAT